MRWTKSWHTPAPAPSASAAVVPTWVAPPRTRGGPARGPASTTAGRRAPGAPHLLAEGLDRTVRASCTASACSSSHHSSAHSSASSASPRHRRPPRRRRVGGLDVTGGDDGELPVWPPEVERVHHGAPVVLEPREPGRRVHVDPVLEHPLPLGADRRESHLVVRRGDVGRVRGIPWCAGSPPRATSSHVPAPRTADAVGWIATASVSIRRSTPPLAGRGSSGPRSRRGSHRTARCTSASCAGRSATRSSTRRNSSSARAIPTRRRASSSTRARPPPGASSSSARSHVASACSTERGNSWSSSRNSAADDASTPWR